jgi:sugar/nucleoside kinase (ribokinase family)
MTAFGARRFTAGAFGLTSWDQLVQVDQYPAAGRYQIVKQVSEQSGGTTANMAAALARLGVDVDIASRVGNDDEGVRLRDELRAEGCSVDFVSALDGVPTDRGIIIVSGSGPSAERTILWVQGARLKHGDYLPIEAFFARDLVLVDVDDARLRLLLLDLPMHVSPRTRIFGTLTYLVELTPAQGFELALRHDYLSGNVAELKYITSTESLDEAIRVFQREMVLSQVRFAAISDGKNGCHLFDRERVIHSPPFVVDTIDPTGAGDAFAAGVAYSVINRWDLPETGQFANAMGALATTGFGARAGLPALGELQAFLNSATTD